MTWLAPGALLVAGVAALAVIAAHLVSWRRPREVVLPTARFVPVDQPPAAARTRALSDVPLLLARLLLIALVGAAAAQPVLQASAGSLTRIVVLDATQAVADPRAARDSALARVRAGDVLLIADSAVRLASRDSLLRLEAEPPAAAARPSGMPLSAVLLAAQREAARVHGATDSLALVLVGAVAAARVDAATDSVRARWPGRIELVQLPARTDTAQPLVTLRAAPDDPLVVALDGNPRITVRTPAGGHASSAAGDGSRVRVLRGALTPADSTWGSSTGGTIVHWPRAGARTSLTARASTDSIGALAAGGHVVVAPFARVHAPAPGAAVAHWADGEAAATERALGSGCLRSVAVEVPEAGDLPLRAPFRRVARELVRPCGGAVPSLLAPPALAAIAGGGTLAPASAFAAAGAGTRSALAPWLWGAALLVALVLATVEAVLEPQRRGAAGLRGRSRETDATAPERAA